MTLLKSILNKLKAFFSYLWTNKKRPKVFIPVILAVIILILIIKPSSDTAIYEIKPIEAQEFVQEVAVSGKVTPAQKVDLSFEVSGKISSVNVEVGARVKSGQRLASLSNAEYVASLQKSQATYQSEQARLAELERGSRPEEIAIAKSDVDVARQNVNQAAVQVVEEIRDSFAKSDAAVKDKADQVFRNPRTSNPELIFFIDGNTTLEKSLEDQRVRLNEQAANWQKLAGSVNADTLTDTQISEARKYLDTVQKFLQDLTTAVTQTGQNSSTDSAYKTYRTDIIAASASINTASQAFNTAVASRRNTASALARAEEQYNLKLSGNAKEVVAAQRAQAQGAAASISSASASLGKTIIAAPFDGIVTRVAYKNGESVGATEPVITIMSDAAFEIETYVSENDAPKLRTGQPAKVTLDALGDAILFDAVVSTVDLSETIKDGVVTYKTRLQFLTRDERIKSGLTANVTVETDRRQGVIKVPQTAIVIQKGKKYVKTVPVGTTVWSKAVDDNATLVPVATGSIDRDGDIEITSGIEAGSAVIVRSSASAQ